MLGSTLILLALLCFSKSTLSLTPVRPLVMRGTRVSIHDSISRTNTRQYMLEESIRHEESNHNITLAASFFASTTDNDDIVNEDEAWESSLALASKPYVSLLLESHPAWLTLLQKKPSNHDNFDPLWESVKLQAKQALGPEPEAGPQLYQGIISQPSLLDAIVTIISHEIETELIPATALRNLFLDMLTPQDDMLIHLDVMAAAMRSRSIGSALTAILFHRGLHALVCYRVGHELWLAGRRGLAYYLQSTVSRKYSADIHPAARLDGGLYLNCGAGIVIGETAVVGQDVTILQGVTLGGTGKEAGDRHPKVGNGVLLHDGATVLGNIKVGDGAVITAKSIVTKPVPPLARVSGVPAKIKSYRNVTEQAFLQEHQPDMYEQHLGFKYLQQWQEMTNQRGE